MTAPYTEGSILQFTPALETALARFEAKGGDQWTEHVLGWAVVVRWVRQEDDASADGDMETALDPVLLDENGDAVTLRDYILEHQDVTYKGLIRRV